MIRDEAFVKASVVIEWHLECALKEVVRKITAKQKAFEPWTTTFTEKIHPDVFSLMYEYFENSPKIGFAIAETWYRNGNIKVVTFSFTLIGVFIHHMKKLSGLKNLPTLLKKKLKNGDMAEVIVSADKPAVISYNYRTEKLSGKLYFKVQNRFGIVLSF